MQLPLPAYCIYSCLKDLLTNHVTSSKTSNQTTLFCEPNTLGNKARENMKQ